MPIYWINVFSHIPFLQNMTQTMREWNSSNYWHTLLEKSNTKKTPIFVSDVLFMFDIVLWFSSWFSMIWSFLRLPTDPFLGAVPAPLLLFRLCFGCSVGRESIPPGSRPRYDRIRQDTVIQCDTIWYRIITSPLSWKVEVFILWCWSTRSFRDQGGKMID